MSPQRVQRKRSKGWTMPPNTVAVDRSTLYGNPFIVSPKVRPGARSGVMFVCVPSAEEAVEVYREFLKQQPDLLATVKRELRGKNLACWCKLDAPCHANVLLEAANT